MVSEVARVARPGREGGFGMSEQQSEAGAGWVMFAGIILITVGVFQAFAGLVGILEDEILVVTPDYLVQLDATTWGWVHMIIGLIVLAAGFGIFAGNVLARTVGVFVAIGSMISMFFWLPWYPVWAIIIIALDITIIWALTVHGRVLSNR
jgi:hypothetical protein